MIDTSPTFSRYNSVAIFIHWLTALAIIGMLAVGWTMTDMPADNTKFMLFQWHKSVGITILLLSVFRLIWRLTNRVPELPAHIPKWERMAAKTSHALFYVLIIGMPLTGWVIVSTSTITIKTMLYYFIPWPHLPILPNLENKHAINQTFGDIHYYGGYLLAALLCLHVGAALKHHFLDKDIVLLHMAPKMMMNFLNRIRRTASVVCIGTLGLAVLSLPAHAKSWAVDYANSKVGFVGRQGDAVFNGRFTKFTTNIDFDPAAPETGKITATIDIASATAGSSDRDAYLPQPDWFNTSKFPQAVFTTKQITKAAMAQCFSAAGTLTLKGVSKNVTLPFCLTPAGDNTEAKGQLTLMRTDFGVGSGQWSGDDTVRHAVDVTIDIVAKAN